MPLSVVNTLLDLTAPLTLRNVYIADVSTSFPLTKYDKDIVVDGPSSLALYFRAGRLTQLTKEIEKEMRNGLAPAWLKARNTTKAAGIEKEYSQIINKFR